jgi:4-hydroxy-4-methyl-2-oxoglutarate aldolase
MAARPQDGMPAPAGKDGDLTGTVFAADRLTTAHLCDVAPFGVAMSPRIAALWPGARASGPAFTVRVAPGDNASLHAAIATAQPGDVLVTDGAGFAERALWGAIMSYAAMRRGIAALVVDGAVRDVEEISGMRFPVFAASRTPVGPYNKVHGQLGGHVTCGGVGVNSGDLVYADDDGVVVIPAASAEQITAAALVRAEREAEIVRGLAAGAELADLLPLLRKER